MSLRSLVDELAGVKSSFHGGSDEWGLHISVHETVFSFLLAIASHSFILTKVVAFFVD